MANMIKFYRGLVNNLPATGENGALYITTDEGAIYYGTGAGMKRLGDFVQVDNVAALPEKAHESCLYYCVAENILAKWNGTEWKQINKQPTAEEMKTLLGLGAMAYLSEVAEDNLSAALKEKVNAAAEGNHAHSNKGVLDGITAEKVAAWDASEQNAKDYADDLDEAMNTRVAALEAIDHEHANKALLDTYTQTEANLADAVAKKHEHANKTELDKIAAGDVAKWNGVVADHLTSADKTALEDSIGDVNTALEDYKTSNNEALAGVKATADAAATKEYTDAELAKKVAKTDYEADKATFATKTELGDVDAKFANYKTAVDQRAIDDAQDAEIAKKVEKVEGKDLIATSEIERLATLKNYDDTALAGRVTTAEGKITALETESAKHALKTEVEAVDAKFADYKTAEAQKEIDDAQDARIKAIEDDYLVEADIADFETKENVKKVADDLAAYVESNNAAIADRYTKAEADGKFALIADAYDDEEVRGLISDNADAIAAEQERAEGIEAGLRTDVDAIKGDYLKAADKTALQEQITANANAITLLTDGADPDKVDGVKDLIDYVDNHGATVKGLQDDIAANAKAIEDEAGRADEAEKALAGRLDVLETIDHEAYKAADTALHTVISKEIDDDVKAAIDAEVARANAAYDASGAASAAQAAAEATAAGALASAKTELEGKIADGDAAVEEKVTALANNTYTKEQTFTKDEVNAAIASAIETAHTWGEF